MEIKIIELSDSHLVDLHKIYTSPDVVKNTFSSKDISIEEMKKRFINDKRKCFVALNKKNKVVGCALITFGSNKRKHCADFLVFVKKDFRKKGIGKQLIEHLIKYSRIMKLLRLELGVFSDNKPAILLYKNIGFEVEGVKKKALLRNKKYYDEILMVKFLK